MRDATKKNSLNKHEWKSNSTKNFFYEIIKKRDGEISSKFSVQEFIKKKFNQSIFKSTSYVQIVEA